MPTEDLIKLADAYAETMYLRQDRYEARQALLDALEALGREVERLTESLRYEVDCVTAIWAERDTLSAELEAIRATAKDAARYRWLRNGGSVPKEGNGWISGEICVKSEHGQDTYDPSTCNIFGDKLDAVIDAALSKIGGV